MHFRYAAKSLPTRLVLSCLVFVTAGCCLALSASAQDIWVDFTSDFHNGDDGAANGVADWIDELNQATGRAGADDFSAAERATIEGNILNSLNNIYADYNLNFVTSQPAGVHEVIYFGQDNDNPDVGFGSLGSAQSDICLLYTSPSPRDATLSRMPSSA